MANGIITPPILVSSATEGLQVLKPNLDAVPIVLVIIVGLFAFQQFGTAIIGKLFGPVMLVFFSMLAIMGLPYLLQEPGILRALNPYYALQRRRSQSIVLLAVGRRTLVLGEALSSCCAFPAV